MPGTLSAILSRRPKWMSSRSKAIALRSQQEEAVVTPLKQTSASVLVREVNQQSQKYVRPGLHVPFRYERLDVDKQEIRLLEVLPRSASPEEQLRCKMLIVRLTDSGEYDAISYYWGDPTPCKPILVNGRELLLPTNGEAALRRMAHPDRPRILWIDSACINQSDLQERTEQVSMMGMVYRQAATVLVYLGDGDTYTERAIANINLLNREIDEDIGPDVDITTLNDRKHITYWQPTRTRIDDDALVHLYGRPWFERAWVTQEFVVARKPQAICGADELDMRMVVKVAFWLLAWHVRGLPFTLHTRLRIFYRTWVCRVKFANDTGINIVEVLRIGRNLEASDPRDKLFGMLGLLAPGELHSSLRPNYRKYIPHVFRDATRRATLSSGSSPLYVFTYISHRDERELDGRELDGQYASWVPRFDRQEDLNVDPTALTAFNNPTFGRVRVAKEAIENFVDPDVFTLFGYRLGTITRGFPLDVSSSRRGTTSQLVEDLLTQHGLPYDKLARTMMADRNNSDGRANAEDQVDFHNFWLHFRKGTKLPRFSETTSETDLSIRRAAKFRGSFIIACKCRLFALTDSGNIGLVPKLAEPGDIVVMVHGGRTPLLIRLIEHGYLLLGECYIDGYMCWQENKDEVDRRLLEGETENFDIR